MTEENQSQTTPSEAADATKKEAKEKSRTRLFQEELKKAYETILGTKISLDKAWSIFKESMDTTVEFVSSDSEKKLPLSGVGTFLVRMSQPRKPVNGGESKYSKFEKIPHFRFKPSDRYRKYIDTKVLGIKPEESVKEAPKA